MGHQHTAILTWTKKQQVTDRARTAVCVTVPVKVGVGVKLEGKGSVSAV